jgi:cobalt-zinc-cadmium efflux system outer membrane protein
LLLRLKMGRIAIGKVAGTAVAGLILAAMAGCVSFHNKSISPKESANSFESRRLDAPEVKTFIASSLGHEMASWPPEQWNLELLTLAAWYYNPDLKIARANWELAKAGIVTAAEFPNPSLGLTPQYDTDATGGLSPWVLNVPLNFLIETVGKRDYRMDTARNLSAAAQWDIRTTAWQVRSSLREALVNVYSEVHKEEILAEQLRLQSEVVRLLEKQLKHGQISRLELDKGRIPEDQARLSVVEIRKQIDENRAALAEAMGLPEAATSQIGLSFTCIEILSPGRLPARIRTEALLSRPDLLSLLCTYDAAQSALQLQIAGQYPNIVLGPGYEFDQGQNKWGLQFKAALPVFNQNAGPIAQAEAKRRQAAEKFEAQQIKVIGNIDRTTIRYNKWLEVLREADTILARRTEQEKAAQVRFDAGDVGRAELLSAKLIRNAAELSRLDVFISAQQALGLLEDAVMRPLTCRSVDQKFGQAGM